MVNTNPSTDDKTSWLIYYPSESPILFNLPMKNIQDAFIEINGLILRLQSPPVFTSIWKPKLSLISLT